MENYLDDPRFDEKEVIINVFPHSEGGLNFDIYESDEDFEDQNSVDGGLCTSGCDKMDEPYTREDYKKALEMAVEQALDALFPEDKEEEE